MRFARSSSRAPRQRPRSTAIAWCGGVIRTLIGFCTALLLIVAIASIVLLARLYQGPISLPGIAELVADRVNTTADGRRIEIGDLILTLGDNEVPAGLQFLDVSVETPEGEKLFGAPRIAASFEMRDVVRGRVRPTEITLFNPKLELLRRVDGRVQVGLVIPQVEPVADGTPESFEAIAAIVDGFVGDTESSRELSKLESINVVGADLTYDDLVAERAWRTRNANLEISKYERGARAVLTIDDLGGEGAGLSLRMLADRQRGQGGTLVTMQFGSSAARDLADQAPGLEWLSLIDGPIEGRASAQMMPDGSIRDLKGVALLEQGVLDLDGDRFGYDFARLAFEVDESTQTIHVTDFTANAHNLDVKMRAVAELSVDADGEIASISMDSEIERLSVALPSVFESDLQFDAAAVTARWHRTDNSFQIASADLRTSDTVFNLSGQLREREEGWRGDLRLHAVHSPIDGILSIWPLDVATNARTWVDENILAAQIQELLMQVRFMGGDPYLTIDFDFEDLDARYLEPMTPLRSVSGRGHLEDDYLSLQVDKGQLTPADSETIVLAGSKIRLSDLYGDIPIAEINLKGAGPISSVLTLIDEPPLTLIQKLGTDLSDVSGNGDMDVGIRFPLLNDLKLEEVNVVANAGLSGVSLDYPVSEEVSLAVTSDRLTLRADTSQMALAGPVRLDGVESQLQWTEVYSGAPTGTRMDLSSTATAGVLAGFGLTDLPLSGSIPFELSLRQEGSGDSSIKIDANLEATELSLPALSWKKATGARGKLELELTDGDSLSVDRVRLDTAELDIDGKIELGPEGGFQSGEFRRLALKDTFDIASTVRRTGTDQYVAVISGKFIDVVRLRERLPPDDTDVGSGRISIDASLDLDILRISEDIALSDASGSFGSSREGAVNARIDGKLGGGAGIRTTYSGSPGGGGKVQIESSDAGRVLRAMDLYEDAIGGTLNVNADIDPQENVSGVLEIENVRVSSEANFRNVLRSGGLDENDSSGYNFAKVWVPFEIGGERITLTDAIAAGSALALKLNGTIDQASGDIDLRGVLSPAYGLTGVLSDVPLLGEILSGGRGEGIVAMTFTLKGNSESPELSVNPLSLLTPGFLRNVFEGKETETSDGFQELIKNQNQDR